MDSAVLWQDVYFYTQNQCTRYFCASLPYGSAFAAAGSKLGCHTRKDTMNPIRIVAIALIVAGLLGLLYGGFSYTKDTTAVKLGPLELSVQERETVNVPVWMGIAGIVAGGLLFAFAGRKP